MISMNNEVESSGITADTRMYLTPFIKNESISISDYFSNKLNKYLIFFLLILKLGIVPPNT